MFLSELAPVFLTPADPLSFARFACAFLFFSNTRTPQKTHHCTRGNDRTSVSAHRDSGPTFPRSTSIVSCEVANIEAFSLPCGEERAREWRTVLESTSGSVAYSFSPPAPPESLDPPLVARTVEGTIAGNTDGRAAAADTDTGAGGGGGGYRRLSVEGWACVRAVIRPSDISVILRSLREKDNDNDNSGAGARKSEADSPDKSCATSRQHSGAGSTSGPNYAAASLSSPTPALDIRVSGAGLTVRLEDDSDLHFVAPRTRLSQPCSSTQAGVGQGGGLSMADASSLNAEDMPASFVRPSASHVPVQPVVEARLSGWNFLYSRGDSERGSGDDDVGNGKHAGTGAGSGGEKNMVRTRERADVSMTMSATTLTVVDLMKRVPSHEPFRELLAIAARCAVPEQPKPTGQKPSLSQLDEWLDSDDHESENAEGGNAWLPSFGNRQALHHGGAPSRRPERSSEYSGRSSDVVGPPTDVSEQMPAVVIDCRRMSSPFPKRTLAIDLGPISANWNPRTIAALWGLHAAIGTAFGTAAPLSAETAAGAGAGQGEYIRGATTRDEVDADSEHNPNRCLSSSTVIRVGAHYGLEVGYWNALWRLLFFVRTFLTLSSLVLASLVDLFFYS